MKKLFSYLLISSMVVLSSCTNYDDQFDDLNSQINSLKGQIEGFSSLSSGLTALQGTVASLQSAVAALPTTTTDISGLEDDLAALAQSVEALQTALDSAATAADVEALQAALDAAQEDITSILASNNVYTGALNIRNEAELTFVESLGDKVGIINGNVTVQVTKANGLSAAEVSAVTSKIASIVGNLTVSSYADVLDFSSLTAVSSTVSVTDQAPDFSSLSNAGNVQLDIYDAVSLPTLVSAGVITIKDNAKAAANTSAGTPAKTGTTGIDLSGLTSATSVGVAAGTITAGTISATTATNINIGDVAITSVMAPKATTITLGFDATLDNLTIAAADATEVHVAAKQVNGGTQVTPKSTATLKFPALAKAGTLTLTAATLEAPVLATASSTLNIATAKTVSLPALKSVTGALTAAAATSFSAPVLAATASVTLAVATSVEIGSLTNTLLVTKNKVTSLTLTALKNTFDASAFVELVTVNSTAASNAGHLTFVNANADLTTVTTAGKHGTVSFTGPLATLTSLTTGGTIANLTISGTTKLASLTLDHTEDAALGSKLTIVNNAELTTFTTKVDRVITFVVTGNKKLASFDASSMASLPSNTANTTVYTLNVTGNYDTKTSFATATGMKGAFTAAALATATAAATDDVFKQNSLLTLKPYLTLVSSAAVPAGTTAATASNTSVISYNYVAPTTADTPLAASKGHTSASTMVAATKTAVAGITAE